MTGKSQGGQVEWPGKVRCPTGTRGRPADREAKSLVCLFLSARQYQEPPGEAQRRARADHKPGPCAFHEFDQGADAGGDLFELLVEAAFLGIKQEGAEEPGSAPGHQDQGGFTQSPLDQQAIDHLGTPRECQRFEVDVFNLDLEPAQFADIGVDQLTPCGNHVDGSARSNPASVPGIVDGCRVDGYQPLGFVGNGAGQLGGRDLRKDKVAYGYADVGDRQSKEAPLDAGLAQGLNHAGQERTARQAVLDGVGRKRHCGLTRQQLPFGLRYLQLAQPDLERDQVGHWYCSQLISHELFLPALLEWIWRESDRVLMDAGNVTWTS